MLREAAQVYHQLPDLFIRQIVERWHRSSWRAVIDNPEQLSVGNFVNRLPAGKIARARIELARQLPAAIASLAVADDLMAVEQDEAAAEKLASPVTELSPETRTTEPKN